MESKRSKYRVSLRAAVRGIESHAGTSSRERGLCLSGVIVLQVSRYRLICCVCVNQLCGEQAHSKINSGVKLTLTNLPRKRGGGQARSKEHTSELQSR